MLTESSAKNMATVRLTALTETDFANVTYLKAASDSQVSKASKS